MLEVRRVDELNASSVAGSQKGKRTMKSTTKDLRYLKAKDTFLDYAFLALGGHFTCRDDFIRYYNSIGADTRESLFLRTVSFYLFLVKRGDWVVDIPGSAKKIDYLTNTYKYIAIFSVIESLADGGFTDFYQYLVRKKTGVTFPIDDNKALEKVYKEYKSEYASVRHCISFFRALSPERQGDLISKLVVRGRTKPSIENLAKFLYELRLKFVHEGELVHHMTDGTTVSVSGSDTIFCSLSIVDAFAFFEEGLIAHFKSDGTT
jgi:hypothetical protein